MTHKTAGKRLNFISQPNSLDPKYACLLEEGLTSMDLHLALGNYFETHKMVQDRDIGIQHGDSILK